MSDQVEDLTTESQNLPLEAEEKTTQSDTMNAMKLKIGNIPSMLGVNQVKKLVATTLELPMEAVVCRKGPKWNHAFITLRTPPNTASDSLLIPNLEDARGKLDGLSFKKFELEATLESAQSNSFDERSEHNSKRRRTDDRKSTESTEDAAAPRCLNDQVTPLWKMTYGEQLSFKHAKLETLLKKHLVSKTANPTFTMEPIIASPIIEGYRNKCEFTIAYDKEGLPTVGFLLGGYREGTVTVENAKDCLHVPSALKEVANHLETFLRTMVDRDGGKWKPYDRRDKSGFWRLMLARIHDGDVMVAIQVDPTGTSNQERALIYAELTNQMQQLPAIKSFFIQESLNVHHGVDNKAPFKLLYGVESLTQSLCGLKFRISPLSFFQVNPPATELLYNKIKEYSTSQATPNPSESTESETILLDLCCGTGTIGMIMSGHVNKVIGVEIVKEAIEDALVNARLNNIENISFECNPVEKALDRIISALPPSANVVVVLDPPRAGVHTSVIKAIRKTARISSVVYVACNPEAVIQNFTDLSKAPTNAYPGEPFAPVKGVAVDLFPHTAHCELIVQFTRPKQQ